MAQYFQIHPTHPQKPLLRGPRLREELGEPMLSATLPLPDDAAPLADAEDIRERLQHSVDPVVDGGHCGLEPTTVIDLSGARPVVVRQGKGAERLIKFAA